MAFDATRGQTVLYGQRYAAPQTWTLTGQSWQLEAPPSQPGSGQGEAMAFDPTSGDVLSFGGDHADVLSAWDGAAWTALPATLRPPGRSWASLVVDSKRHRAVLFGGEDATLAPLGDTWEWDGAAWADVTPASSPPARARHAMTFDAARGRTVLFGGDTGIAQSSIFNNDTWEWDGAAWTLRSTPSSPSPRLSHALAYDSARGRPILFGGLGPSVALGDTWEWDGQGWTRESPSGAPLARAGHAMTFDPILLRVLLFGGHDFFDDYDMGDLWEYGSRGGSCSSAAQCDTAACVDGVCCDAPSCGTCARCDSPAGPGSCVAVTNAADPDTCAGVHACSAQAVCLLALGQPASTGAECASGFVTEGVCCASASCGTCQSCATASNPGSCAAITNAPDPNACTGSRRCDGQGVCREADAQPCTRSSDCASGACADGVCCSTACDGPCVTCSSAGVCGLAAAGTNPRGQCVDDGAASCGHDGVCDASGACELYAAGASCEGPVCTPSAAGGHAVVGPKECDGIGACIPTPSEVTDCGLYGCDAAGMDCLHSCATTSDCISSAHCVDGACTQRGSQADPCTTGEECLSGYCADGVCCDEACTGQCQACDQPRDLLAGHGGPARRAPRVRGNRRDVQGPLRDRPARVHPPRRGRGLRPRHVRRRRGRDAGVRRPRRMRRSLTGVRRLRVRGRRVQTPLLRRLRLRAVLSTSRRRRRRGRRDLRRRSHAGDRRRHEESCAPYRCSVARATCLVGCGSKLDCVAGLACSPEGACVAAEAPTGEATGGCAFAPPRASSTEAWACWALLACVAAAAAARRRRVRARALALAVVAAATGCRASEVDPAEPEAALAVASRIASFDRAATASLAPRTEGFTLEGRALVSPAWRSRGAGRLDGVGAQLPATAQAAATVGVGRVARLHMSASLDGASAAPARLDAGRVVYDRALPSTDLVFTASPGAVEAWLLLRDDKAPSAFTWRVALPDGVTGVERWGARDEGLAFVDRRRRPVLFVPAPFAIDAAGGRHAARVTWEADAESPGAAPRAGRLVVSLDARGLRFPVLLDPSFETSAWRRLSFVSPVVGPPLAFDSARGRVVLFAGATAPGLLPGETASLGETREWDGAAWQLQTPAHGPVARDNAAIAYDARRAVTLLFGGATPDAITSETWAWNGTDWAQRAPLHSPGARESARVVYDSVRERIVLFGGVGYTQDLGDTWEWDGSDWKDVSPPPNASPPPQASHAMAYDAVRRESVLYGLGGTWKWDGAAWTHASPAHSPDALAGAAASFDPARGQVVLFGGKGQPPTGVLDETWEWDGVDWTRSTPALRPEARSDLALAFDGHATLLFGGTDGAALGDTWEWDGGLWTELLPQQAPPLQSTPMAFDSARGRAVLYAGASLDTPVLRTWEWDGAAWALAAKDTGPPAGAGVALAFDASRAVTVLFGGFVSSVPRERDVDLGRRAVAAPVAGDRPEPARRRLDGVRRRARHGGPVRRVLPGARLARRARRDVALGWQHVGARGRERPRGAILRGDGVRPRPREDGAVRRHGGLLERPPVLRLRRHVGSGTASPGPT